MFFQVFLKCFYFDDGSGYFWSVFRVIFGVFLGVFLGVFWGAFVVFLRVFFWGVFREFFFNFEK